MMNPAEPNKTRKIEITYTTDDDGDMEINIDSSGFEDEPQAVPLFLYATLNALTDGDE
jgi:hypothetical protein